MIVIEYKLKGKSKQYQAIDEAIRTCQFIRNKSIRYWMDNKKVNKYDLSKLSTKLGKELALKIYIFINQNKLNE